MQKCRDCIDNIGTLIYLKFYGNGEAIKFLLHHANVKYTLLSITPEEKYKMIIEGSLPSGDLPIWITPQGQMLHQKDAILRFLGQKLGYYKNNA